MDEPLDDARELAIASVGTPSLDPLRLLRLGVESDSPSELLSRRDSATVLGGVLSADGSEHEEPVEDRSGTAVSVVAAQEAPPRRLPNRKGRPMARGDISMTDMVALALA